MDIDTCGYCFILTEAGDLQADVIYYKLDSSYLLFSEANLMDALVTLDDVVVENKTDEWTLLQIEGKESSELAQECYEYDISTLNYKDVIKVVFNNNDFWLSRFGYTGEFGYQFIIKSQDANSFIREKFIDKGIVEYGESIEKYTKFEVGHPIEELYRTSEYNIHELGFTWNVDFTKLDFKGKDALLRKVKESRFSHIGFYSQEMQVSGTEVLFEDQVVGKINLVFEALENSNNKKCIGSLMIDSEYAYSGISFATKNGGILYTMANPYVIPESWAN